MTAPRFPTRPGRQRRRPLGAAAATLLVITLVLGACAAPDPDRPPPAGRLADWPATAREARGQTVRWWMYGGDERVNRYVDELVRPAAAAAGVTLERVPVADTADAVRRVLAERRAGRASGGSVDLLWINGENFALGKQAGLWLPAWTETLPNARYVDWDDPTIARDFGVPVDGQESPWNRATFVFAYDERRTSTPPRSFQELLAHARAHPGRVAYPAPPDFTGSAFVRQAVQTLGEEQAFALLGALKPLQWRDGTAFPGSQAELDRLFADGQVDFAMSYDPSFIAGGVRQGKFPRSARPFVLAAGALQNASYVTIPANAAHRAGALVVANLLLEPRLQAAKADPERLGIPTVLDLSRLPATDAGRFRRGAGPYVLAGTVGRLAELPPEQVTAIEARWQREVLRR
jgi:putative spermidine/putrescine transport system substrate-binding protein